jgi:predicted porin
MKKTLLGSTALVAVGLLASPALASDPLKVTIGGNVVTGFYVIDADSVGGLEFQDTKVALVARNIDIKAEGTLDNGLVAGVMAKLQLNTDFQNSGNQANISGSTATFRQLFAYLEGGFGKFEIGGTDGAAYKMHYTSPWFVPGNGVDSPNIYNHPAGSFANPRSSTFSLMATDANKVSYFTPRLAGFQLGASFTPDTSLNGPLANGNGTGFKYTTFTGNNIGNVFEIAANYAGTLGGVDVGVDGFYVSGSVNDNNPFTNFSNGADPEEYGFGANLGYAGFTLGGAYYKSSDLDYGAGQSVAFKDVEAKVWTAGLKYATGPWQVGIAYLKSQDEGSVGPSGIAGLGAEQSFWQIGGGYSLGSGVDLGLDLQLIKAKPASGASDIDAKSAGLVLAVAF